MQEEKQLLPKLRFSEFEGVWERKDFKEVVKINQGLQIAISERLLKPKKGALFYITNEFLNPKSDKRFYIENASESVICNEDDILMTRTGNTGKVVTNVKGAFHNNFFRIAYPSSINKEYLYNFLILPKTQNFITRLAGTSTIPDLNHSDFYKIKFSFPNLSEQKKIANFLTAIDNRIHTLEKKKTLLEQYKKGVMQKIFKQELRFKDDTSTTLSASDGNDFPDWEEKKLGETGNIKKGKQLNKEELTLSGTYPCQNGGISPSGYTEEYNTVENTITISEGGNSCGYVNYMRSKFWCGGHCYSILELKKEVNALFLFQYLKFNEHGIMRLRVGSGLPNIQKKDLLMFEVQLPCIEEQTKIANFLSAIDRYIELVTKKIEHTKTYKKGLLQQMFV
jgi:type I restriction enzyme S subunit